MGVFELSGFAFLTLYVAIAVMAFALSVFLTARVRPGGRDPQRDLHAYEVAALAGGAPAAVQAAVTRLVKQKRLAVREGRLTLGPAHAAAPGPAGEGDAGYRDPDPVPETPPSKAARQLDTRLLELASAGPASLKTLTFGSGSAARVFSALLVADGL